MWYELVWAFSNTQVQYKDLHYLSWRTFDSSSKLSSSLWNQHWKEKKSMCCSWVSQMWTDSFLFSFFFLFFSPLSLEVDFFPWSTALSFQALEFFSYLIPSCWTSHSNSSQHSRLQEIWSHCSCSNCFLYSPLLPFCIQSHVLFMFISFFWFLSTRFHLIFSLL